MEPLYSPQSRAERLIAAGRVVLAASSLFAVWLDPTEPAKYAQVAYSLLAFYVLYSGIIAVVVFHSDPPPNRQRLFTQVFDLSFFSLFLYLTAGPASPFLIYFVFSLVCATLRWQRRGVFWTTVASLCVVLGLGLYFSEVAADPSFKLYPLVIRGVYLAVIAVLLGYLGAYEEQTRREMASLAAWPDPLPQDRPQEVELLVGGLLEHAAKAVGAGRALLAWGEREEPWLYLALWDGRSCSWARASPGTFGQLVAEPLQEASFLCPDVAHAQPAVLLKAAAGLRRWRGKPLDPALRERYEMGAVLAVRVVTESVEGLLFFLDKKSMTSDDLVLGEVVADAMARRLDHFYLNQQLQETVATEERIRLARDLHDGVLQSLTGIGLRLAAIRGQLEEAPGAAREGLDALQRLIALEQRDIRFFIRELKPPPLTAPGEAQSLPFRLADLVQRIEVEWGLKVDLRTEGLEEPMPQPLAREVYHLVREGLVNAVRHGEASEVRVEILRHGRDRLAITVIDNGRGFPFHGRLTHGELAEGDLGPRNLLERVASMDGTLTLESSARGARLEIALPWAAAGA
jgi:signal transduction histidine kinase